MTTVVQTNVTTAQEYQDALEKSYLMPEAATVATAVSDSGSAKTETDRLKITKPPATAQTLADAISLASSVPVGEFIQTAEYNADTGIGGNTYQKLDAGSSGARPDEDGGSVIHLTGGSGGLYLEALFLNGIWVGQFGATGLKGVDASAAFNAAYLYACYKDEYLPTNQASVSLTNSNYLINGLINIDHPKEFHQINQPRMMMGAVPHIGIKRRIGLTFKGESKSTLIHFESDADDYLCFNDDEHLGLKFQDLRFSCNSNNAKFMLSLSDGGAQEFTYDDVFFHGKWQRLWDVRKPAATTGDTNSEWKFFGGGMNAYIQDTMMLVEDSDQFLNFWWFGSKLWIREGQCIRAENGGHFQFINCDWSGLEPTMVNNQSLNGGYLFELNGRGHASGVCKFLIVGGRFEHKTDLSRLIYCEWDNGNVDIEADCRAVLYTDPLTVHAVFDCASGGGINVSFKGSALQGVHKYSSAANAYEYTRTAKYDNCSFYDVSDITTAFISDTATNAGGSWPVLITESCTTTKRLTTTTESVALPTQLKGLQSKSGNLRKFYATFRNQSGQGTPNSGETFTLNMPSNAIITNVTFVGTGILTSTATPNFQVKDGLGTLIAESSNALNTAWYDSFDVFYLLSSTKKVLTLNDSLSVANQRNPYYFVAIEYIGG